MSDLQFLITYSSSAFGILPFPKFSCLSLLLSNPSLESLKCTRSIFFVSFLNPFTASSVGIPPAQVWQVSKQSPTLRSPMTSQSRSIESMYRATEFFPPAVFSTKTLIPVSSTCSIAFLQFSYPSPISPPSPTDPP